jgi:uncharacterized protein (DUF362 family)
MTRRDLLGRLAFGVTFLSALGFAPRSLLSSLLFEPDAPLVPARPIPVNPFVTDGKALVAIVHGDRPADMLSEGLAMLGGFDRLGVSGRRVLIKPNVVNDRPPPSTTSPDVIAAAVSAMQQAGAVDVTVADSSGMLRFPTSENLESTGIRTAVERLGSRLLALEVEPWLAVEPPAAMLQPRMLVSKPVYDAEVLINLPVVKTHRFAHYSCSLKNVVGVVHPRCRPSLRFLAGRWHEHIAELNLAVHPRLTVADGTTVMIAGGPTSGTPARANVLLLSGDRVALDAVAVALIRSYGAWDKVGTGLVWEQRQIKRAAELGLGVRGPREMELMVRSLKPDDDFKRRTEQIERDVSQG